MNWTILTQGQTEAQASGVIARDTQAPGRSGTRCYARRFPSMASRRSLLILV
jgi:hypothetical protein